MTKHIIDEMPERRQVEEATPEQLVEWYFYLRPTMMNDELDIVKAIAQRVERMPDNIRIRIQNELRARHG